MHRMRKPFYRESMLYRTIPGLWWKMHLMWEAVRDRVAFIRVDLLERVCDSYEMHYK